MSEDCEICVDDCGDKLANHPKYEIAGQGGTLWFVSRTCNFSCTYCYQGDHSWTWQKNAGLKKLISDEVVEKSIPFINAWGSKKLTINWYGGEPLLAWPIIKKWTPKLIDQLSNNDRTVRVSITTNGSLLNEERRQFLDEHKMGILFSLDGPPYLHNKTRVLADGKPSWDTIPVDEILAWRPNIEIAWQIDPENVPTVDDLQWMRDKGFININFNINWLKDWSATARLRLSDFMYETIRLAVQSKRGKLSHPFRTNWLGRIEKLVNKAGTREDKPCGTGFGMLAITPEGYIYPSQEMAFTVFEPGRAPGTAEYYRIGDLFQDPVINYEKLEGIVELYNDEMEPPAPFDCERCGVRSISFGGCHCRFVGQDGIHPEKRFKVPLGWCKAQLAACSGGLLAFAREGYVVINTQQKSSAKVRQSTNQKVQKRPLSIVDLDKKLDKVLDKLENK